MSHIKILIRHLYSYAYLDPDIVRIKLFFQSKEGRISVHVKGFIKLENRYQ